MDDFEIRKAALEAAARVTSTGMGVEDAVIYKAKAFEAYLRGER